MGKGPESRTYRYAKKLEEKAKEKKEKKRNEELLSKQQKASGTVHLKREKKIPQTIEMKRVEDKSVVSDKDTEILDDFQQDEFTNVLQLATANEESNAPKVLLTSNQQMVGEISYQFLQELLDIIPRSEYYPRRNYKVKEIVQYAAKRQYVNIVIVNEDRKAPVGVTVIHLPTGPTATFKLSNYLPSKKIQSHGRATEHYPELMLNHFTTRLGYRVGRLLMSLFPQVPGFEGRQVATFHNQRDYIFFRRHRYIFKKKEDSEGSMLMASADSEVPSKPSASAQSKRRQSHDKLLEETKVGLQEIGPRFTLKLHSLQKGTFDSTKAVYEFIHKPGMDKEKKRFYL